MTLRVYHVELVTEEPATLGIESETAFRRDVYRHVPGIVLRGALAAIWIGQNGPPDGSRRASFRDLFEAGLRPGPLLPDGGYIRPLSVTRCKYPPSKEHARRSLHDQAFEGRQPVCIVDRCGRLVEAGRGEVEFDDGGDPVTTLTHVPHGNQTGVAVDGGLHARHYLRPGTRFTGRLSAPADDFLDSFAGGGEIWLGGRRTVAGRARLTLTPVSPGPPPPDLAAEDQIALRLDSPGVFVDDAGRPSADPVPELAEVLGLVPDQCQLLRRWWRPVTIRGWHVATGLPKPTDHAAAAGSTWLVRVAAAVPGDRLTALVAGGLGLRRTEGFGLVTVARDRWRMDPLPPAPAASQDLAVEKAATLWPYLAAATPDAQRARSTVSDHLRDLAGAPPDRWDALFRDLWTRQKADALERIGIRPALAEVVETRDLDLVRDVRLVLEAAARQPVPRWLRQALAAGASGR